ncbi:MAG: MaoC/PaaZ C-terminal domain-containing protein [Alphaproteobacteria bacterium]|nr:MaoC/PaaZ C-terminal domain-containing protein [Alphaproteobacteria bacterium]
MRDLYYEDVRVGSEFVSVGRTVSELDLNMFAMLSGDMHPIHTDSVYAATTPFGQRILHGPFGVALAIGLFGRFSEFQLASIALTEIREWKFRAPVFVGDTLHLEMQITGKTESKSGRGFIDRRMRLINQKGAVVQEGLMGLLIAHRTPPTPNLVLRP